MCHCRLTILSVWHRQWKYRSSITWWTSHPNRPSIPTCPKGYAKARNAWVFLSSWWSAHGDSIFLKRVPLIWGHHTKLNSIVNNNAEFGNKSRYTHIYIYIYFTRLQMSPNCNHCNPHWFFMATSLIQWFNIRKKTKTKHGWAPVPWTQQ